jgi:hypothetical protein
MKASKANSTSAGEVRRVDAMAGESSRLLDLVAQAGAGGEVDSVSIR